MWKRKKASGKKIIGTRTGNQRGKMAQARKKKRKKEGKRGESDGEKEKGEKFGVAEVISVRVEKLGDVSGAHAKGGQWLKRVRSGKSLGFYGFSDFMLPRASLPLLNSEWNPTIAFRYKPLATFTSPNFCLTEFFFSYQALFFR